jgi:hypothetical protein
MRSTAPRRTPAAPTRRAPRLFASALLLATTAASADSVTDWNVVSGQVQPAYGAPPGVADAVAVAAWGNTRKLRAG